MFEGVIKQQRIFLCMLLLYTSIVSTVPANAKSEKNAITIIKINLFIWLNLRVKIKFLRFQSDSIILISY